MSYMEFLEKPLSVKVEWENGDVTTETAVAETESRYFFSKYFDEDEVGSYWAYKALTTIL